MWPAHCGEIIFMMMISKMVPLADDDGVIVMVTSHHERWG